MGRITLSRFRTLVLANPGFQGKAEIDNDLVDEWINLAYSEVVGGQEFDELVTCASMSTENGVSRYTLPESFAGMISVADATSGGKIIKSSLRNLDRLQRDAEGYPQYWARSKNGFTLWPVPDQVLRLEIWYVKEPAPLTEEDDVTIIPATFDTAIFLMAQHFGLMNFNEFEAADKVFIRALGSIRSRRREADIEEPQDAPVWVPRSWDEVINHRPEHGRY